MQRIWPSLLLIVSTLLPLSSCTSDEPASPKATPTPATRPLLAVASVSPLAAPSPSASPLPTTASYTVKNGDSLSTIAELEYGDASQWQVIFEANRDKLSSPDSLAVGMVMRIPPPTGH